MAALGLDPALPGHGYEVVLIRNICAVTDAKAQEQARKDARVNGTRVGAAMSVQREHIDIASEMLDCADTPGTWAKTLSRVAMKFSATESSDMYSAAFDSAIGRRSDGSTSRFELHDQARLTDAELAAMFRALHHQRMMHLVGAILAFWRHTSCPSVYAKYPAGRFSHAVRGCDHTYGARVWLLDEYFTPAPFFDAEVRLVARAMNLFLTPEQKESELRGVLTHTLVKTAQRHEERISVICGEELRRMNVLRELVGLKAIADSLKDTAQPEATDTPDDTAQPPAPKRQKGPTEPSAPESDQKESGDN